MFFFIIAYKKTKAKLKQNNNNWVDCGGVDIEDGLNSKQNRDAVGSEEVNVADRPVAQNLFGFDCFGRVCSSSSSTAVASTLASLRFFFGRVKENREIEVGDEVDAGEEEYQSSRQENGTEHVQTGGELKEDGGDCGVHAGCEQNVARVFR